MLVLLALACSAPAQARLIGVVIGVSQYSDPHLSLAALPGASIDAAEMASALRSRNAGAADLAVLTGADATAAAIREALNHAVASAAMGDRVVLYLSGHGAQIPARPGDANEPDGLDEVFLGADAGQWNASSRRLPGSVKDDEFGGWIDQLRAKGASVWFVVDACNGGGLQRDGGTASARTLDPALLGLPPAQRGGRSDASGLADATPMTGGGKLVTFYAAPAGAVAWERPLASPDGRSVRRGVFTWSLLRALGAARADANFLTLASDADDARRSLGPPGGPAWISGDLDQPMLFSGPATDLLAYASARTASAPVGLRLAMGPAGPSCPGEDPDPLALATPAGPVRIEGCRRLMVELHSGLADLVTLRPWYRDAAGGYVALAGAEGITVLPGDSARFGFTVTDRDPSTGHALPSGDEYLLLIADKGAGAVVVPFRTGQQR
ncbi:hypothetical protein BH09PSE4_BH09PSE4_17370 [soil metagenome]